MSLRKETDVIEVSEEMAKDIKDCADSCRCSGDTIEINTGFPYVAISFNSGEEYYFQGDEADNLLKDIPDNVFVEDFLLWKACGW